MKIMILGYKPSPLKDIVEDQGVVTVERKDKVDIELLKHEKIDFIISYGYRHIIPAEIIEQYPMKIINLHISFLPWNRGSDPNFWSFFDSTPKGVSIHYIDEGIDTGNIIAQKETTFSDESTTLRSAYEQLQSEIIQLFKLVWPQILSGKAQNHMQNGPGSYHKKADINNHDGLLAKLGWETPVKQIVEAGETYRQGGGNA